MATKIPGYFLLFGLLWMIVACQKAQSVDDLNSYVFDPDNGLHKKKTIGPVNLSVTYRPTDLLVQQSANSGSSAEMLDSLRKGFNQFDYFVLSLSANDKDIEGYALQNTVYGERIQLLSFGLTEYIRIITDQKDTIPLANYSYQRMYGVGKTSDFLLSFEKDKIRKAESFRFQVSDFGIGIGDQNIRFETKNITKTPQIALKAPSGQ